MSKQEYEVYYDDPLCDYYSEFSLLCNSEMEVRKVDKMILTALKKCATRIGEIRDKHRSAGIGDTATDEAITSKFYELLH